jgi:hypothetical protein
MGDPVDDPADDPVDDLLRYHRESVAPDLEGDDSAQAGQRRHLLAALQEGTQALQVTVGSIQESKAARRRARASGDPWRELEERVQAVDHKVSNLEREQERDAEDALLHPARANHG